MGSMKRAKNTSLLWDELWEGKGAQPATLETLKKERASIRWRRIREICLKHFGSLTGKRVVELGSGMGTYAALFAMEGADVTLVDYSPKALRLAREFFTTIGLKAHYVEADIFTIDAKYTDAFDISTSCGVAEHFLSKKRKKVLTNHLAVVKPGGMTILMVPNRLNAPYRTYKAISERGGFWPWGEEYPFSRSELESFVIREKAVEHGYFGDSLLWSFNYFNPLCLASYKWPWFKQFIIPQTYGTPLDERLAYSLGLWAVKGNA